LLDNFKITIYSVELSALEPLHLPVYKGSTLRGGVAPFWPWLKVGELVHLGKNTAFGLGKTTIAGISKWYME
jgi:hypothetical protein